MLAFSLSRTASYPPALPDQGQALPGTFTKYAGNPIVTLGASGAWDDKQMDGISAFWDRRIRKFVLVYGGYSAAEFLYKIGLAYADSPLGPWTKEATNPVLTRAGYHLVAPVIVQLPDLTYRMYVQHFVDGGSSTILAYSSSDLLSWTALNGGSPIVSPVTGTWLGVSVFSPWGVLQSDGTTRLFFTGQDSFGSRGLGYATLDTDGVTVLSITPTPGDPALVYIGPGEIMADNDVAANLTSSATHYCTFPTISAVAGYRWLDRIYTSDGATFTREEQVLQHGTGWESAQVFDASPIWWKGTLYLFYCGSPVAGMTYDLQSQVGVATMPWP
jgi:hypothetical protein